MDRADELARLEATIQLSEEFTTIGFSWGTCCYSLDSAITNLDNDRWATLGTGKMMRKILKRLGSKCIGSWFKLQTSTLSRLRGTYAKHMGLGP